MTIVRPEASERHHQAAAAGITGPLPARMTGWGWDSGTCDRMGELMIFITAKFKVKPEYADAWPQIAAEFTQATLNEPGCLWFDWSRSVKDPQEYVLVEAFRDGAAGAAHVQSEHFKKAQQWLPPHLAETPKIINFEIAQDDWSELGELAVSGDS